MIGERQPQGDSGQKLSEAELRKEASALMDDAKGRLLNTAEFGKTLAIEYFDPLSDVKQDFEMERRLVGPPSIHPVVFKRNDSTYLVRYTTDSYEHTNMLAIVKVTPIDSTQERADAIRIYASLPEGATDNHLYYERFLTETEEYRKVKHLKEKQNDNNTAKEKILELLSSLGTPTDPKA